MPVVPPPPLWCMFNLSRITPTRTPSLLRSEAMRYTLRNVVSRTPFTTSQGKVRYVVKHDYTKRLSLLQLDKKLGDQIISADFGGLFFLQIGDFFGRQYYLSNCNATNEIVT